MNKTWRRYIAFWTVLVICTAGITVAVNAKSVITKNPQEFRNTNFRGGFSDTARDKPPSQPGKGADTDGDGLKDREEKKYGTDINDKDTDDDLLTDGEEVKTYGTSPTNPDTDAGGIKDGDEVKENGDPLNSGDDIDADNDGLSDSVENNKYYTNPLVWDTDSDKMSDGFEAHVYQTDPLYPNDKFAVLVCTDYSWTDAKWMYEVLTIQYRYSDSEIRKYDGAPATAANLKDAIMNWIVPNDDPHDIVYIMIGSHGYDGGMVLNDRNVPYSEFDSWLDNIYCFRLIVSIDNCHSGSAIDYCSQGPCPRVIYTACTRYELSYGYFHERWNNALGRVDAEYQEADKKYGDGQGYVGVAEAFEYAKYYTALNNYGHPQESDTSEFWHVTFLGQYLDAN